MITRLTVPLTILCVLVSAQIGTGAPPFKGGVAPIPAKMRARMTPDVWRPGCPVPLRQLRAVVVTHRDFRGRARRGVLVVHRTVARDVLRVFRALYAARFPIRRIRPIEAYGGDDYRSIEADNTSVFNCRAVSGGSGWSRHAYGTAIDINPIENPYVSNGRTSHRRSVPFLRRTPVRRGMAVEGGVLVRSFDTIGWSWGGRWTSPTDYQHFSTGG
ncbi:MAG: M15 family metallopeptidase [Thermoleophilia bacterium]